MASMAWPEVSLPLRLRVAPMSFPKPTRPATRLSPSQEGQPQVALPTNAASSLPHGG